MVSFGILLYFYNRRLDRQAERKGEH
jgi:hypothetical protein